MPLIAAWLSGFILQAVVRHFLYGTWLIGSLAPMTSVAFLLFTFYMITDPQTSPSKIRGQIVFGLSVGGVYGVLIGHNVVYVIFVSLLIVCAARGVILFVCELGPVRKAQLMAERAWFSFFRPAVLTDVPVTSGDIMERRPLQ